MAIYQLITKDFQTVALEVLGRKLTKDEIEIIKSKIAEKINWFDAIESAINEEIVCIGQE